MSVTLRLKDGTAIAVPASLRSMTTFVILEQEQWFEKEAGFARAYLRPGMTAVDIGANHGVYALSMARRVGPNGSVYAYEPAAETCGYLSTSKEQNRLQNLHIIGAAVADRVGPGHLRVGSFSELNMLADDGDLITVTTLDAEQSNKKWPDIDFVKIDTEGAELQVLAGGAQFFAQQSPLVMFEIKDGTNAATDAAAGEFRRRGYRIFRLLQGQNILIPVQEDEDLDRYELNLFAAKADRAAQLERDGFLVSNVPDWMPDDAARAAALIDLKSQAYAADFKHLFDAEIAPAYLDALAGFTVWRSHDLTPAVRVGALRFAFRRLHACTHSEQDRLATFARVAWEYGARDRSVGILEYLSKNEAKRLTVREPFWPVEERFDHIPPGKRLAEWFNTAVLEALSGRKWHSLCFFDQDPAALHRAATMPFRSFRIDRGALLLNALQGQRVIVPARLFNDMPPDHVNAKIWQTFPFDFEC